MYEKENAHSVIWLQFKFISGHVLSAKVILSYNVWSERKKFKCGKLILTTQLREKIFKSKLTHLQTKHSPWFRIQKVFLSCTDLPLTSAEGFDVKPCRHPAGPAPVPTIHRLSNEHWVPSGHPMLPAGQSCPSSFAFPWARALWSMWMTIFTEVIQMMVPVGVHHPDKLWGKRIDSAVVRPEHHKKR